MKKLGLIIKETQENYIKDFINQSQGLFIVGCSRISSPDLTALRQSLKEKQSRLFVVKNTIACRVLEEIGWRQLTEYVKGISAFVFIKDDPVATSKILKDFQKEKEGFQVRAGLIGERLLTEKDIEEIAKLPSKQALYGQVVMAIRMVLLRLLFSLKDPIKKIAICIEKIKEKKG